MLRPHPHTTILRTGVRLGNPPTQKFPRISHQARGPRLAPACTSPEREPMSNSTSANPHWCPAPPDQKGTRRSARGGPVAFDVPPSRSKGCDCRSGCRRKDRRQRWVAALAASRGAAQRELSARRGRWQVRADDERSPGVDVRAFSLPPRSRHPTDGGGGEHGAESSAVSRPGRSRRRFSKWEAALIGLCRAGTCRSTISWNVRSRSAGSLDRLQTRAGSRAGRRPPGPSPPNSPVGQAHRRQRRPSLLPAHHGLPRRGRTPCAARWSRVARSRWAPTTKSRPAMADEGGPLDLRPDHHPGRVTERQRPADRNASHSWRNRGRLVGAVAVDRPAEVRGGRWR